jgi:hypothetical protein
MSFISSLEGSFSIVLAMGKYGGLSATDAFRRLCRSDRRASLWPSTRSKRMPGRSLPFGFGAEPRPRMNRPRVHRSSNNGFLQMHAHSLISSKLNEQIAAHELLSLAL